MMIKDKLLKKKDSYSKSEFVYSYTQRKGEKPEGYIGNAAKNDLISVVYGYSVGYKKLYEPFLPRIINWISEGVEKEESFDDIVFHQYRLTSALAFSTWLYTGINNIELWKNSLKWQDELYRKSDYTKGMNRIEQEEFALQILHYIQAQEYEKGIRLYQSIKGDKPLTLNNNMSGYRIAYAYCLHFHEGKFTVEQLEKASKAFLEKHLVMLYTMGRSTEMLYWLKMVCDAREKDYTPEEVIYTFYEYIPEEEKPDFIKELLGEKAPEKKSFFSFFKW